MIFLDLYIFLKSGTTIDLNIENLPLYKRVIEVYENNTLKVNENNIFINGELAQRLYI